VTAPPVDAERVIADLRELDRLTGGPGGARRVAWGEEWRRARERFTELVAEIGLAPDRDPAGNLWVRLEGAGDGPAVAVGSHLDSVPAGGWLDGALGVMAGLGVLRAWAGWGERPPRDLVLVDWADEEGARFGHSLLGSSAVAGSLDSGAVRELRDQEGRPVGELLAENGVELERMHEAAAWGDRIGAYLELHIEQGPVLESESLPVAAVDGCVGIERRRFRFRGQASHAGTTPMDVRRDAGLAAAETALAVERIAREHGGVGTTGELALRPGIVTAVAGEAELSVDLRHPGADELGVMHADARGSAERAAGGRGVEVEDHAVWRIDPTRFDPDLVATAREACRDVAGTDRVLTSGALHDAAEIARIRPAAMLFCASERGLSHAPQEDSSERDLALGIQALATSVWRLMGPGLYRT
jgi:hydantoinase/carbamoylase family amidase